MIKICFGIDDNYVSHLLVVLESIKRTTSTKVDAYVISESLQPHSVDRLKTIQNKLLTVRCVFLKDSRFNNLTAGGHISKATYLRFAIPELVGGEKVIYLDADLIVKEDLSEIWGVDLDDYAIGAVENPCFIRYESLNILKKNSYFNAGVLLINLGYWREHDVPQKSLNFMIKHKDAALMNDQDALNVVCNSSWIRLPLRWNLQTSYLLKKVSCSYSSSEIEQAIKSPGIIHYSASAKPWEFDDVHPMQKYYREIAEDILPSEELMWKAFSGKGLLKLVYRKLMRRYSY